MMIKAHPVSLGKHNNVHYLAKDKSKNICFKLVVFSEYSTAFITYATCSNIDSNLLNNDNIIEELKKAMLVWDTTLYDSHIAWNVKKTTEEIVKEHLNYFV